MQPAPASQEPAPGTASSEPAWSPARPDAHAEEILREYAKYLEKRDAIRREHRTRRRASLRDETLLQS